MRWKLSLLFIVVLLIINVEAKTLSSPESRVVDEFEDADKSKDVGDGKFYINVPKGVSLVNASFDIKGSNVENVKIKIDGNVLFENDSLDAELRLDLKNNVSTSCDIICRWELDISTDDDFTIKNLFINYTFTQTPLFFKYMRDINWSGGTKLEAFYLDEHFYGSSLVYKNRTSRSGSLDYIDVIIESTNEVKFVAREGWEGIGYVYFVADDDEHYVKSNEIRLSVGSGETKPYQFSPSNSSVVLDEGEEKVFGISGLGSFNVDWYLDDRVVKNDSYTYIFKASRAGSYSLEARIGDIRRQWSIRVLEKEVIPEPGPVIIDIQEPVCGNGVKEENETCENCPEDVKCLANAKCVNGECVLVEGGDSKWLILGLSIFAGVIGLVVVFVILIKKGKMPKLPNIFKKKEKVSEEKSDLSSLRSYLIDNLKKGHKKEELVKAALKQGWDKNEIDKVLSEYKEGEVVKTEIKKEELPDELEPLLSYIRDGIKKGYKREGLISAALKIGWKREQIDEVLKKV